jgi:hypothetical protein
MVENQIKEALDEPAAKHQRLTRKKIPTDVWKKFYSSPNQNSASILEQSIGTRNRVGIGLPYRPSRARICKRLRSPGIDSEETIPPVYEYVAWRAGTTTLFLLGS